MINWRGSLLGATTAPLMAAMLATMAYAQDPIVPAPDSGTFHHRVLWIKDPASQAVLSWNTREEGTNNRVYFDRVSRAGDIESYSKSSKSFKTGKYTMREVDHNWVDPAHYHHVHLSDLRPDTVYYVVFATDESVSQEFHFRTAPGDDKDVAVLFGGDSRIGGSDPYDHNDRQKMNRRMSILFEENPDIIAFVHGGDYCQLAEWRYLEPWLSDHELTTTSKGRLLPIIPARGNHDRGVGYVEMFSWPDLGQDYYFETTLSSRVSIITLNTEISLGGDQRDWLDSTLERVRPENRWVVASYHRPSYPSVRTYQDGATRRDNWVDIFEKYTIDLALESHDHALKRTVPIRAGEHDPENGVVYIGDGGLGVPQRNPDPERWYLQEPGLTKPAHHVHVLRFNSETLRGTAYGMDAKILDDFTLTPRKKIPVSSIDQ
ncbi:MAG: metallophosphoesterase family protein [Candidatus Sumerlaeia bacterium]|nr:metallophosphoesterase family protein [Candidatus Sumerlaeia bacterium]